MDGVTTHIDGLWHEIKVGTILVHRLPMQPQEPTRGPVVAHLLSLHPGLGAGVGDAYQANDP
jgi:hypothetical protein